MNDRTPYMNIIPPGIIVELANGERLGSEDMREHLLEQWAYRRDSPRGAVHQVDLKRLQAAPRAESQILEMS